MRILYLSLSYVPSTRASSVQVMRMCEAFALRGHDIELIAKRPLRDVQDPHTYYGVEPLFGVERLARPALRGGGLIYALAVTSRIIRRYRGVDLIYSRDLIGACIAAELGLPLVFEAHGVFDAEWQRQLWRRMVRGKRFRGLVVISQAMRRELAEVGLLDSSCPVVVAHSPANRDHRATPRREPSSPARIGYVGSMYPGRGVELVVEVAAKMQHHRFDLIGGSEPDLAYWRAQNLPRNVTLHGFVRPADLARRYGQLDVLLMPYPHQGIHGATRRLDTAKYCSPMKMFEYMASGVPIVSSDLPVLQEVLVHEQNALIAPSGDVQAWCSAIDRAVHDHELRIALGRRALTDLEGYTTTARVDRILSGLGLVP